MLSTHSNGLQKRSNDSLNKNQNSSHFGFALIFLEIRKTGTKIRLFVDLMHQMMYHVAAILASQVTAI